MNITEEYMKLWQENRTNWNEDLWEQICDLADEMTEKEFQQVNDEIEKFREEEAKQKLLEQEKKYNVKVLYQFDIAWVGWKCDSQGHIIELANGERGLCQRNPFIPDNKSNIELEHSKLEAIEVLEKRIKEYQRLIKETEKALEFLK